MPGPFVHNIDPVIGQIGGMYLWWYGLSYTLGFLTLFRWTRGVRGFLDMDVRQVYDLCISVAAGVLIAQEAGGTVTSPDGGPFVLENVDFLAASTDALHQEIRALVATTPPTGPTADRG